MILILYILLSLSLALSSTTTTTESLPPITLTNTLEKPTLLLNMLTKNEEVHLKRVLPYWAKIIDYYIIGIDEFNTDNSVDIIKFYLANIPGQIVTVKFIDMGTTWSILVKKGVELYPQATHGILADADFCPLQIKFNKNELKLTEWKHSYTIKDHKSGNTRSIDWIYRNKPGVKVTRRTHQTIEVPVDMDQQSVPAPPINFLVEERQGGYQDRSGKKHEKYLEFLEADLKDYPNDPRTLLYLGNAHYEIFTSHRDNPTDKDWDHLKLGLDSFKRRYDLDNSEQSWNCRLRSAEIYVRYLKNWKMGEKLYNELIKHDPHRIEPYIFIGNFYRNNYQSSKRLEDIQKSKKYLIKAAKMPIPDRELFMNKYMYTCLAKLELARTVAAKPDLFTAAELIHLRKLLKKVDCSGGNRPSNDASETHQFIGMLDEYIPILNNKSDL